MDDRFIEMIGPDIVKIAETYEQLTVEDLLELKEMKVKDVWCVYDNWMDLAKLYVELDKKDDNIPEYLTECVDIEKLGEYLKSSIENDYEELKSGKVIQASYE